VIWLLPPEALRPSPDPIRPTPIAISATLVTLIFVALVVLYNRKPKHNSAERKNIKLENRKASIRVIRPASTAPAVLISPALRPARSPPPCPGRSPPQSQTDSGSDTISEPQVRTYHNALKDTSDTSYNSSSRRPSLTSTSNSYRRSFNSSTRDEIEPHTHMELPLNRPASSDHSVSIGPTPSPSRHNSVRIKG
jgi:hypothetical protein